MKFLTMITMCFIVSSVEVDAKKKAIKDWSKIDYDKVEEEWKGGDSDDELVTEDELLYREMEHRKEQPIDLDGPMDPEAVQHQQSNAGPSMMFLELRQKDGGYGETELVDLGGVWRDLLFSGGIDVKFYNIEENRMLASLQKGWDSTEVKNFLLDQKEVAKVTWDSVDYFPSEDQPMSDRNKVAKRSAKATKKMKKKKKKQGAVEHN
mmetsp:Transcript_68901/g.138529  ORF Transcript_68901/g.138529 Transcript_68901/m.138529 type:complete len:207 (+) Transcript_68901:116-736(+)